MTDKLREALETVQQAAADLQRDMDRLAEIKATIRVNALRGGATTDEVEAMVRGEKSFVDFLAKLCDTRAALAAAPQPAVADREALVEVIARQLPRSLGNGYEEASNIADALLARGLRLPGDAEAERDAAFAAGQESMRERAAKKCQWHSDRLVETIRALPIKPGP